MARLDSEKKERDAVIDEDDAQGNQHFEASNKQSAAPAKRKDTRTVRDPVTGKDVEIRDTKMDFEEAADNPKVRLLIQTLQ